MNINIALNQNTCTDVRHTDTCSRPGTIEKCHRGMILRKHTWGINSFGGSLTTFKGELKLEGPTLCFTMRGEPDVLLGERGGAVPAGNMEGNVPLVAFGLEQFPGTFREHLTLLHSAMMLPTHLNK